MTGSGVVRFAGGVAAALLLGCAAPPTPLAGAPAAPPSASATIAPPAATGAPSIPSARPSRGGECQLDEALADFLGKEPATRCGDLPTNAPLADYERLRTCILAAVHAQQPFTASVALGGIDSFFRQAYAARRGGAGYEVRWFRYDSCPSGCGDQDPAWWSATCNPLMDLRVVCAAPKLSGVSDALRGACEERGWRPRDQLTADPRIHARRRLELWCDSPVDAASCPAREATAP